MKTKCAICKETTDRPTLCAGPRGQLIEICARDMKAYSIGFEAAQYAARSVEMSAKSAARVMGLR